MVILIWKSLNNILKYFLDFQKNWKKMLLWKNLKKKSWKMSWTLKYIQLHLHLSMDLLNSIQLDCKLVRIMTSLMDKWFLVLLDKHYLDQYNRYLNYSQSLSLLRHYIDF